MGTVSELPSARLSREIRESLESRGSASAVIADLPISVDEWRRLARAAARSLGRPVETIVVSDTEVAAALRDWPANPNEEAIHRAALRKAINRLRTTA